MQLTYRHFVWRYALAHYGKSLFWYASELLFPFYLTEIGLFSGWVMGLVVGTSLLFSMLADLAVGWLARRHLSSARRAGQCLIIGGSLSFVSILGFFACAWVPPGWRIQYAMAALMCFRFTYAAYDIAQDVLVNLATSGRAQRAQLSGLHFSFSGLASITVATLVTPMIGGSPHAAHAIFFGLVAVISIGALASSFQLGSYLKRSDISSDMSLPMAAPQRDCGSPMFYFTTAFLLSMCGPVFVKVAPYYGSYAIGHASAGSVMISLYSLGIALAFPLLARPLRKLPPIQAMTRMSMVMTLISAAILGVGWINEYLLYAASFALGISFGALGILSWAGFADAISHKQRQTVSFDYAQFLASAKAGLFIATVLIGTTLSSFSYKSAQGHSLMLLMALPPVIAGLALTLVCWIQRRTPRETAIVLGGRLRV